MTKSLHLSHAPCGLGAALGHVAADGGSSLRALISAVQDWHIGSVWVACHAVLDAV